MVFPTNAPEGGRLKFTSTILPPYLRRAKSIEELLPWLYLKGISTGDFSEALAALLGPDAPGRCCQTNANSSQFSSNSNKLGCEEAAPLSEGDGAVGLETLPTVKRALLVKMVEDRRVNGCKLL